MYRAILSSFVFREVGYFDSYGDCGAPLEINAAFSLVGVAQWVEPRIKGLLV